MAWFLCLTCAVKEAPGVRFYLGPSPDPSLPRPGWRLSIKTPLGNLVPEVRNWEAGTGEGVPGDVKHPSLGLARCHRVGGTSPRTPPALLAVHGRDGFYPQWEGFAISHKAAYRARILQVWGGDTQIWILAWPVLAWMSSLSAG